MRSLFAVIALFAVFSAHASVKMPAIFAEAEVEALIKSQNEKGFTLAEVKDVYANQTSRPRCACENFVLSFTRPRHMTNAFMLEVKKFNVSVLGFGANMTVNVQPVR